MTDANTAVSIGDENLSLSELAGFDLSSVKEVRNMTFPVGTFHWRISDDPDDLPRLDTITTDDGDKAIIRIPCICDKPEVMKPDEKGETPDPEDIVGKKFTQSYFLSKVEDLGRFKAFVVDTGAVNRLTGSTQVQQVLEAIPGTRFMASITHRKNKNNPDEPFPNMDTRAGKIIALD